MTPSTTHLLAAWLFYQLPEGFLLLFAGQGVLGISPPLPVVLKQSLIYGLAMPLFRSLPLPFGVHTVLRIAAYALIVHYFSRVSLLTGFVAAALSMFFLSLGENLLVAPAMNLLGLNLKEALGSVVWHVGLGWLSCAPVAVIGLLVWRKGLVIIPAPEAIPAANNNEPTV